MAEIKSKRWNKREKPSKTIDHVSKGDKYEKDYKSNQKVTPNDKSINEKDAQVRNPSNPFGWHENAGKEILNSVANISWLTPTGLPFHIPSTVGKHSMLYRIPGVMSIRYKPMFGGTDEADNQTVTMAARSIFSFVRSANSGSKNYEATDLFMYLMGMSTLVASFAEVQRLISLCKLYKVENRNFPYAIAYAMGYKSIASEQGELLTLLGRYNIAVSRFNQFCLPDVFPITWRWAWLNSNVYYDDDNARSQIYVFQPTGSWEFSETLSKTGSSLNYVRYGDSGASLQNVEISIKSCLTKIERVLSAYTNSTDLALMSGDVLKAYGVDRMVKLKEIDPSAIPDLQIYHNTAVLEMVSNLTVNPYVDSIGGFIQDDNGNLGYASAATGTSIVNTFTKTGYFGTRVPYTGNWIYNPLLNISITKADAITPVENIELTRLHSAWNVTDVTYGGANYATFKATVTCTSEAVEGLVFWGPKLNTMKMGISSNTSSVSNQPYNYDNTNSNTTSWKRYSVNSLVNDVYAASQASNFVESSGANETSSSLLSPNSLNDNAPLSVMETFNFHPMKFDVNISYRVDTTNQTIEIFQDAPVVYYTNLNATTLYTYELAKQFNNADLVSVLNVNNQIHGGKFSN